MRFVMRGTAGASTRKAKRTPTHRGQGTTEQGAAWRIRQRTRSLEAMSDVSFRSVYQLIKA
jgi:hypothetical protein